MLDRSEKLTMESLEESVDLIVTNAFFVAFDEGSEEKDIERTKNKPTCEYFFEILPCWKHLQI